MSAKEKALELVDTYYILDDVSGDVAIQCAIIAVDEILSSYPKHPSKIDSLMPFTEADKYWSEVKQELEKML